jgi:hypothetical protein
LTKLNALKRFKNLVSDTGGIFILLFVAGCTTTTSGSWEEPRTTNAPYNNVLIVALTNTDEMRLTLERELVQNLSVGGATVSASASLTTGMKNAPRSRESIVAMAQEKNADAVLLLRVADASVALGKSKKEKEKYLFGGAIEDEATSDKEKNTWTTPRTSNSSDALPNTKIGAEMIAALYDLSAEPRSVYTIDVKTKYKQKGGEMIFHLASNIATGVADELRSKGLVK